MAVSKDADLKRCEQFIRDFQKVNECYFGPIKYRKYLFKISNFNYSNILILEYKPSSLAIELKKNFKCFTTTVFFCKTYKPHDKLYDCISSNTYKNPFRDNSFDFIIDRGIFDHYAIKYYKFDKQKILVYLQELVRLLSTNGQLILFTLCAKEFLTTVIDFLYNNFQHIFIKIDASNLNKPNFIIQHLCIYAKSKKLPDSSTDFIIRLVKPMFYINLDQVKSVLLGLINFVLGLKFIRINTFLSGIGRPVNFFGTILKYTVFDRSDELYPLKNYLVIKVNDYAWNSIDFVVDSFFHDTFMYQRCKRVVFYNTNDCVNDGFILRLFNKYCNNTFENFDMKNQFTTLDHSYQCKIIYPIPFDRKSKIFVAFNEQNDHLCKNILINGEPNYPQSLLVGTCNSKKEVTLGCFQNYALYIFFKSFISFSPCHNLLNIGLGGGILSTFIENFHKNIIIHNVEISNEMVNIAKEHFYFEESPKNLIFIEDGIKFIEKAKPNAYDIIMIHVYNNKYDVNNLIPHPKFISEKALGSVCKILKPQGALIFPFYIDEKNYKEQLYKKLKKYFQVVICSKINVNTISIAICTNNQKFKTKYLENHLNSFKKLKIDPWFQLEDFISDIKNNLSSENIF